MPRDNRTSVLRAKDGFSLIGLLVAVAILGITANVLMTTYSNHLQATGIVEDRQALEELRRYIRIGLGCSNTVKSAPRLCSNTLVELSRPKQSAIGPLVNGPDATEPTKVGKYWLRAKCLSNSTEYNVEYAKGSLSKTEWLALFEIPLKCES